VIAGPGLDTLHGGTGNDTLNGGTNADLLYGEDGADTLNGGSSGNDTLDGGAGNDSLTGGTGVDVFVFHSAFGLDNVTDFVSGTDKLSIDHALGVSTASDVMGLVTHSGSNTVITFDASDVITLTCVASIAATDISIVRARPVTLDWALLAALTEPPRS